MNWTYFLEHESDPLFSSADVGICGNTLSLVLHSLVSEQHICVSLLSHSELLHGKKPIEGWKCVNGRLEISLSDLTNSIHILQVASEKDGKNIISKVALLPAATLPKTYIIVGSPRSGTTVVGNMVQQALQTQSHGEAHIAELFNSLIAQSQEYLVNSKAANNKGTLVWEMPSILLKAQLIKQLRDVYVTYYGSSVIVDKTPGLPMLRALPLLMLAFPNAKVLYCQRRGIENVASRLRKFPNAKFEVHCKQWAKTLQTWKQMKKRLSQLTGKKSWYMDVEQFELAVSPKQVTQDIGAFLSVDEQAIKRMFEYQEKNSPQVTGGKPSDVSSLDKVSWTDEQKQVFTEICADAMQQQGYSLDEHYYTAKA